MIHRSEHFDPGRLQGQYAGFVTRGAAVLIDLFIISTIYSITAAFSELLISFLMGMSMADLFAAQKWLVYVTAFGASVLPVVYHIFFWTLTGQTPGKAIMGIRVYRWDGERVTLGRAIRRYIGYSLSAPLFGVGFLWALIDNRRQTWHDKLAGTVVVYSWQARVRPQIIKGTEQQ